MDVPAGVTREKGHTGFLIHLPSAVHAFSFLVDREVEFCVLTIESLEIGTGNRTRVPTREEATRLTTELLYGDCRTTPIAM